MIYGMFRNSRVKNIGKAALGLTAAGTIALNVMIIPWEQNKLKPYLDIGGIPTACAGVTGLDVTAAYRSGKVYTPAECNRMNARAVAQHEKGLRAAIDDKIEPKLSDLTMAAFISFTYNVGVKAAAKSTLIKLVNKGDFRAACGQLGRWVSVRGVTVAGLQNRRVMGDLNRLSERSLCLMGIDPNYTTPLAEKLFFDYKNWVAQQTKDI